MQYNKLLERMVREGELIRSEEGISLPEKAAGRPAVIVKVKPRFGFARIEGEARDVFVPGRRLMGSMPGDRVMVRISASDGMLDEGEVLSVLERADPLLSGTVTKNENGELELAPDASAYSPVRLADSGAACKPGDKVIARIETHGGDHRDHRAVVTASFGSGELAKNCCGAILAASGVEREFSAELLECAEQAAAAPITERERANRLDLRDEPIFTIDGADTKDIDDAISLKKAAHGWKLGVHIADVSRYVTPGSLLDADAMLRGTSVYFADSVIPMLPKALSNGACSLNPGEERLAFSALLSLDEDGVLDGWEFRKSLIRSQVKGVYAEVNRILDGSAEADILQKYAGLTETLHEMHKLSALLHKNRFQRGSMELSSAESKIVVDADGRAADILPRVQGESEKIIEEFMLAANEAAATQALSRGLPFVYRVHEPPSPEKLSALKELLDAVGLPSASITPGVSSAKLSELLEQARRLPCGMVVNSAMLRAMQKARYDAENFGHYGLALQNYAHFTSPIRRYPDLAIHRILTAFCSGETPDEINRRYADFAQAAAKQSSAAELRAMGIERSCEDCYKAEYIHGHLGEVFEGVIVSAMPHGVYVMLDNTVEGLIRTERLGD
ncbi:MAG: VacB/RNase II family 3'-5' exoribonuclease, partial [Oscillospiraceae bacterium]